MATAGHLASRVSALGGAALLIDYGRNRPYPASLQAIKQHKFCGLLEQPGLGDLSAHVDFGAIRHVSELWSGCILAMHCALSALSLSKCNALLKSCPLHTALKCVLKISTCGLQLLSEACQASAGELKGRG